MAKDTQEVQQSIEDKVKDLQANQVRITQEMNDAPEDKKPALQEEIKTIERKLRWYAGRSNKAPKQAKVRNQKKEKVAQPESPTPAPSTVANES